MAASNTPQLLSSEKTVTTAGTAVALATSGHVSWLLVLAKPGNTGQVYLGGSDVASTTNDGLPPGASIVLPFEPLAAKLSDIYIDSDVNGEGVDFYAIKA